MRRSRFDGAGYLLVDNRASGGLREEADLLGCGHCHGLVKRAQWSEEGAYCHKCDSPLCASCAAIEGCTPFERSLQRAVDDDYRRRQNAKILGI